MRRRRRVSEEGPNAQSERAHNESKGGRDGGRGSGRVEVQKMLITARNKQGTHKGLGHIIVWITKSYVDKRQAIHSLRKGTKGHSMSSRQSLLRLALSRNRASMHDNFCLE